MKFGVLQFFSWPERRVDLPTVYERAVDRVKIMDQNGYDAVWLAEHHFSTYSVCPSVHLMGMHLAHQTENLRIGMGVSLAGFYHPLRLAEEVALLDNLSGGRINWGAGRGFDLTEMNAFGVSREDSYEKFRENVEIVLAAWQNERLSYQGKYYQFDDIEVLPKPYQDPMPTWIATSTEPAIEWAAGLGHAILMDPHSTHDEIGTKRKFYYDTLAQHGFSHNQDIPIARLMAIAPTDEKARAVAQAGAEWTVGSYANGKTAGGPPMGLDTDERLHKYMNEVIIYGCPERVADQLLELSETIQLEYLLASILSHETFVLLTEKVLPRIN